MAPCITKLGKSFIDFTQPIISEVAFRISVRSVCKFELANALHGSRVTCSTDDLRLSSSDSTDMTYEIVSIKIVACLRLSVS